MCIKKSKILSTILIFLLCFPFHFLYDILPNTLFSIFFPVNESIYEHMKMMFSAIIFYGIIDYFVLKKCKHNNFLFSLWVTAFLSIFIYLAIYLPIFNHYGENMIVSITLLFIVIAFTQVISYYILNCKDLNLDIVSIILIVTSYIVLAYLTYNPIKNYIFLDTENEKYGINDYQI